MPSATSQAQRSVFGPHERSQTALLVDTSSITETRSSWSSPSTWDDGQDQWQRLPLVSIQEAQRATEFKMENVQAKIAHHANLAQARLEFSSSYIGTCLSMNQVMELQKHLARLRERRDRLVVLKENIIGGGTANPTNFQADLEDILTSVPDPDSDHGSSSDELELLLEGRRQLVHTSRRPRTYKSSDAMEKQRM